MWDGLASRVCDQGGGVDLGVRPARGQCRQRVLGHLGRLETCGLSVKAWARDGRLFARPSLVMVASARPSAPPTGRSASAGPCHRGRTQDPERARCHLTGARCPAALARSPARPSAGWGIRVIQPRGWRLEAWSPWESVASALRSRGSGPSERPPPTPAPAPGRP